MVRKGTTEREAAEMWVEGFNAFPTAMIEKLVRLDEADWKEVTIPSYGCETCDDVKIEDLENSYIVSLPMWGRMWAFSSDADNRWLSIGGGVELMSKCGFRIYESRNFGYFFGIDASGCDFYEAFWLPLYRARGMQWHDPATEVKEVAA